MNACFLRDAVPGDAAALLALRKTIFGETSFMLFSPDEYSTTPEELSAQIAKGADSGMGRTILAEADGKLIGYLGVWASPTPRLRHSAHIVVGVLRSHWGRGVGRALLLEALRWAPTAGLSRLELFVMTPNSRAIALYESLGFVVEGHRRRAYVIDGVPVDDQLMAYVFEA